jgi:hypothetical protein
MGSALLYLFTYGLFNDAVSNLDCTVSNGIMNREGSGRRRLWASFSYYPGNCLEGLRETTEELNQRSRCPGRDKNRAPAECKPEVLQHEASCLTEGRMKTVLSSIMLAVSSPEST